MNGRPLALVHGLGRFGGGAAAAAFLHRRGYALRVADRAAGSDLDASRASLEQLPGIDWQLGREDPALLAGVDLLVLNPAVPDGHPLVRAARAAGIRCTQEVDLFLEHYPGQTVAVSGTNGKSTTATLLHAALSRAGLPALLGGNIGQSLLADEARWERGQTAVLEISSFQLERVDPARHRVAGAVLTRIGSDHLDRHGSLWAYRRAKGRLAAMADGFLVHAADDLVAAGFATRAGRRIGFALGPPPPGGMGRQDGWLVARLAGPAAVRLVHEDALRLLGDFQRENALAAAAAALLLGAPPHAVGLAIACLPPLPFRLQLAAVLGGVRVYDNGVSTELESTASAVRNLEGAVHWVGGGKSKDGDFDTPAAVLAPRLSSAHLFGDAARPLAARLGGRLPTTRHERLDEALDAALAAARPGDAILWSPAFASFDQYPNFRSRALAFHRWLDAQRTASRPAGRASGTAADAPPDASATA